MLIIDTLQLTYMGQVQYILKYAHVSGFACFVVIRYWLISSTTFTSLALQESHDYHSAGDPTLRKMGT